MENREGELYIIGSAADLAAEHPFVDPIEAQSIKNAVEELKEAELDDEQFKIRLDEIRTLIKLAVIDLDVL